MIFNLNLNTISTTYWKIYFGAIWQQFLMELHNILSQYYATMYHNNLPGQYINIFVYMYKNGEIN